MSVNLKNSRVFAIDPIGNWDLWAKNENGKIQIYYVAKWCNGCESGYFGDLYHIKKLMISGYLSARELTPYGAELIKPYIPPSERR